MLFRLGGRPSLSARAQISCVLGCNTSATRKGKKRAPPRTDPELLPVYFECPLHKLLAFDEMMLFCTIYSLRNYIQTIKRAKGGATLGQLVYSGTGEKPNRNRRSGSHGGMGGAFGLQT